MRVILKDGQIILITETDAERVAFTTWRSGKKDHVFRFDGGSDKGGALHDLVDRI